MAKSVLFLHVYGIHTCICVYTCVLVRMYGGPRLMMGMFIDTLHFVY